MAVIKQIQVAGTTYDIRDEYSHYITKDVDNLTNYTKTNDLSTVSLSGSYNDLTEKPTIPASTTGSLAISINTGIGNPSTTTYTAYSNITGTTTLNIDLSPYARIDSMPIATNSMAGCIKIDPIYALTFDSSSKIKGQTLSHAQYLNLNTDGLISKGTLDNVFNYYLTTGNVVVDANYHHTDNNYTTAEKTKLAGIAAEAEINQNSYSSIKVEDATTTLGTITANDKTDVVSFKAGTNINLIPDMDTKTITIVAIDTTYSSLSPISGGADVSLVTTGEKFIWNNKSDFSGDYNNMSNTPLIPSNLDDLNFANIPGYDSNETQRLVHIQGSLHWETIPSSI